MASGKTYTPIIDKEYQWNTWAAPKLADGRIDHNALSGDDLADFVNVKLFPYLKKFKTSAESADTIESALVTLRGRMFLGNRNYKSLLLFAGLA